MKYKVGMSEVKTVTPKWRYVLLRDAARMVGLSKKTLRRRYRLLQLVKGKRTGRWYVRTDILNQASIITLGRASKRIGIHYETIRRWVKNGKLQASYRLPPSSGIRTKRMISMALISKLKRQRR